MVGIVGDPALQALHGPQNFPKSRYPARFLVWAMENETVKSLGVPLGHALSSATKLVDLSQKSTGFDARGKEIFFGGSRMCSIMGGFLRTIQASFAAFSLVPGTEFHGFICGCPHFCTSR